MSRCPRAKGLPTADGCEEDEDNGLPTVVEEKFTECVWAASSKAAGQSGVADLGCERTGKRCTNTLPADPTFCEGDEVVLASGTYQGTLGVFLRLRKDVNWADISERNGNVRGHPVMWLAHATSSILGSTN